MKFIVQHTCKKDGGEDHVLANAPFYSEYNPDKNQKPFLGAGYYFWEYNIDYAKIWGNMHYESEFYVCESKIDIDHELDGYYLDIAGNREHLVNFVDLLTTFNLIHEDGTKGIDLCYIIDYLRNIAPEVFPFKVIRAVDNRNDDIKGIKIQFNDKTGSFTFLNPRIILSFFNKADIVYISNPFIKFAS